MNCKFLISAFLTSMVSSACGPSVHAGRPTAPRTTSGITFTIDRSPDGGPAPGIFNNFEGAIYFAAGRGRLDITERSNLAGVVVAGLRIGTPLGVVGDYYLFDSTGFVLVRPASKAFVTFKLSNASFNFQNRRDGWLDWFQFYRARTDTLAPGDTSSVHWRTRGAIHIYWHLDDARTLGQLTLADAPASEIAVARWFGMSQALAVVPTARASVLLTAVAPLETEDIARTLGPQINLMATHETSAVSVVEVPVSSLQVPADFTETRLSGTPPTSASSENQSARWKRAPRGE
jgi:hypothetical protein